jgi:hypothetical protein
MRAAAVLCAILLLSAAGFGAEPISGDGALETLETAAYKAVINKNGTIVFTPSGAPQMKVSFIHRWVKYQRADQIAAVTVERENTPDGKVFHFKYFWNGGSVRERLTLSEDTFEALWDYTPFRDKRTEYFTVLCETGVFTKPEFIFTAMKYDKNPGDIETLSPPFKEGVRLSSVTMTKKDGPVICLVPYFGAWLWIPPQGGMACVTNNGFQWRKTEHSACETYTTGIKCFILRCPLPAPANIGGSTGEEKNGLSSR